MKRPKYPSPKGIFQEHCNALMERCYKELGSIGGSSELAFDITYYHPAVIKACVSELRRAGWHATHKRRRNIVQWMLGFGPLHFAVLRIEPWKDIKAPPGFDPSQEFM